MEYTPIIAVDFDGTLSLNSTYPNCGDPNIHLINWLNSQKEERNAKIVLWTCREGKPLEDAIKFCTDNGLTFDAVNENIPELEFSSRKVVAEMYIDDNAIHPKMIDNLK